MSESRADLAAIAAEPGVVASEGPRPVAEVPVRFHGRDDSIGLIGLPRTRARIESPVILEGRRIRGPGEIVLWRGYAREHAAAPGDTIQVGEGAAARTLRVVGIGATTGSNDGGWADPADVARGRAGRRSRRASASRSGSPSPDAAARVRAPGRRRTACARSTGARSAPRSPTTRGA